MPKKTARPAPKRTRTNRKVPTRAAKLEALRKALAEINETYSGDLEACHHQADLALLEYIDDAEVLRLFDAVKRMYA